MVRRLVTFPDGIIRRRTPKRGLTLETIVVLVLGLLGTAGFAFVAWQAMNAVETSNDMFTTRWIGVALRPALLTFVAWILFAVGAHVVANTQGGRGPIKRLMRGAAWALIPVGIWNLIRSAVVAWLYLDVDIPAEPEGLTAADQVNSVLQGTGMDGFSGLGELPHVAVVFLGVLFVAWSWHLLSVAVSESKDLDLDTARQAAAVPAALLALYLLWTGLGYAGVV